MADIAFIEEELPPVLICELTPQGWRGLTADGQLLNVGGGKAPPESLLMSDRAGNPIGVRAVPKPTNHGAIGAYLEHFDAAGRLLRCNEPAPALADFDAALAIAPTMTAKFNRAMALLALGRWPEGFAEYAACEQTSQFMRPTSRAALAIGLRPWQGEDIAGRRLLLVHDHGFGDSIMMLRFVLRLKAMGADVLLLMPAELTRLAEQIAPVVSELEEADYFCSMLMLMHALKLTPSEIPLAPYLKVNPAGARAGRRKTIGLAWSVGKYRDGDFPRAIELELLIAQFGHCDLVSVQLQERERAARMGAMTCTFADFYECAAMMRMCDEIVTVDTAALHLAGAIGHPRITALLSHWHSWRWLSPWYGNVTFLRQAAPGDWQSALAAYRR